MVRKSIVLAFILVEVFNLSQVLRRGESALAAGEKPADDQSLIEDTFKSIGAAWECVTPRPWLQILLKTLTSLMFAARTCMDGRRLKKCTPLCSMAYSRTAI